MTAAAPAATFSYVVRCAFERREHMEGFLSWLRDPHIADVLRSGASAATIVVMDSTTTVADVADDPRKHVLEARYEFESRQAFETYEREEAPARRSEGLAEIARLGIPASGVKLTRTTGEIVLVTPRR